MKFLVYSADITMYPEHKLDYSKDHLIERYPALSQFNYIRNAESDDDEAQGTGFIELNSIDELVALQKVIEQKIIFLGDALVIYDNYVE